MIYVLHINIDSFHHVVNMVIIYIRIWNLQMFLFVR